LFLACLLCDLLLPYLIIHSFLSNSKVMLLLQALYLMFLLNWSRLILWGIMFLRFCQHQNSWDCNLYYVFDRRCKSQTLIFTSNSHFEYFNNFSTVISVTLRTLVKHLLIDMFAKSNLFGNYVSLYWTTLDHSYLECFETLLEFLLCLRRFVLRLIISLFNFNIPIIKYA